MSATSGEILSYYDRIPFDERYFHEEIIDTDLFFQHKFQLRKVKLYHRLTSFNHLSCCCCFIEQNFIDRMKEKMFSDQYLNKSHFSRSCVCV